jgi:hypothetical protein
MPFAIISVLPFVIVLFALCALASDPDVIKASDHAFRTILQMEVGACSNDGRSDTQTPTF